MPPTLRRPRKDPARPPTGEPDSGTGSAVASETPPVAPELPGRDGFPDPPRPRRRERRRTLAHATPVLLLRAAHPRVAVLTAGGLAIAAAIAGRPSREVGLVLATVLVGQALLG